MSQPPASAPTDPPPTAARTTRAEDHDRTLRALQQLERATGSAAGRAHRWYEDVLTALVELDAATANEQRDANQPDSLLSDIVRSQPRLRTRVRGIRAQYVQIRESVISLRHEMTESNVDELDITDLRRRTERFASALRNQRARESDLIYEAYYETYDTELDSDITTSM